MMMKKTIKFAFLISCMMFGCKKEATRKSSNNATGVKYPVTFNISGFTQTILGNSAKTPKVNSLGTNASVDTAAVNVLFFLVYDSRGHLLTSVKQGYRQLNFGSFTDSLTNGTYTIAVVGDKQLSSQQDPTRPYFLVTDSTSFYYQSNSQLVNSVDDYYSINDTFYKKFTITVAGAATTKSITLDRVIAQLQVRLLNFGQVTGGTFQVDSDALRYSILKDTPESFYSNIYNFENINAYYPYNNYLLNILNTSKPLNVTITVNGTYNLTKTIAIQFKKNTRTVLVANTYKEGTGLNSKFNISFNTSYAPDTLITHF